MGCCCKKEDEPKQEKICCVCNPFDQDGILLTAQIASILAACMSWVWWPLMVVAAPIVVILQMTWCCKMKKRGLLAASIISFVAFGLGLFLGIYMATACWQSIFVVVRNDDDDYYWEHTGYDKDTCDQWSRMHNPTAWTVVAFLECALFLLTFVCTTYFTMYRYDTKASKWARQQCEADADECVVPVVEMGVLPSSAPHATATIMAPDEKDMDTA